MSVTNWTSVLGHQLDASSAGLDGHRVSIDPCPSSESGEAHPGLSASQGRGLSDGTEPSDQAVSSGQGTAPMDPTLNDLVDQLIVPALVARFLAQERIEPTDDVVSSTAVRECRPKL
jgi:hypothetical protein